MVRHTHWFSSENALVFFLTMARTEVPLLVCTYRVFIGLRTICPEGKVASRDSSTLRQQEKVPLQLDLGCSVAVAPDEQIWWIRTRQGRQAYPRTFLMDAVKRMNDATRNQRTNGGHLLHSSMESFWAGMYQLLAVPHIASRYCERSPAPGRSRSMVTKIARILESQPYHNQGRREVLVWPG